METQQLGSFAVPLLQHLVVCLFLFETHFNQHPHLLQFYVTLLLAFDSRHIGLVDGTAALLLAIFLLHVSA